MGVPPWVYFTSGSLPNLPTRITLLTELAMILTPIKSYIEKTNELLEKHQPFPMKRLRTAPMILPSREDLQAACSPGCCRGNKTVWTDYVAHDENFVHVSGSAIGLVCIRRARILDCDDGRDVPAR